MNRLVTVSILIALILTQTSAVYAQVPGLAPTSPTNTGTTNTTLTRFNPSIGLSGSGNNFSGMSFSGVGGALLSCTNVGSAITGSLSGIFNKAAEGNARQVAAMSAAGAVGGIQGASILAAYQNSLKTQQVPVKAADSDKELRKQTQTQNCLNGVAYAIAKNMLQQMTMRTLSFVNTGFGGNPLYVRDMDSFLRSIRDDKISSFLREIPSTDPVFGNAIRSAVTQQVTGYTDGRINQVMNTPEARQYQAFQEDFTQGGWSAFLNPRNNALGAYFSAVDNVSTRISTAQQNVRDELEQGDGFLSVKTCVEWSDNYDMQIPGEPAPATDPAKRECLKYQVVTPGKLVAEQTTAVTTSPVRQLEQADQINEVLGAFFDQLLSRLFVDGLGGLTRSATRCINGAGVGCNVVVGSNGTIISSAGSLVKGALGYEESTGGFNGDFDITRPQQVRAITQTQMTYFNRAQEAQEELARIIPTLGALDYCIPGPNPTWQEGLAENYGAYVSTLSQPSPDGPNALQQFLGSIPGLGFLGGSSGPPPILISQGVALFDKVTGNTLTTRDRPTYNGVALLQSAMFGGSQSAGIGIPITPDIADGIFRYIEAGYQALIADYQRIYDPQKIVDAFVAAHPDKPKARSEITDALRETSKLPSYNIAINEYDRQYADRLMQTEYAIRELTEINKEIQAIVQGAKDRYIRERAATGNPVDRSCIDLAYQINTSPIKGRPSEDPVSPNPFRAQSIEASRYFYSQLYYD